MKKKQKEAFKEKKAVSKRKRKEKWIPKQFETLERSGETWRPQDKHINGEELIERYGIRAGEFGNWTNTLERQASLDQAYDAFADLAFALDIDEKSEDYLVEASRLLLEQEDVEMQQHIMNL